MKKSDKILLGIVAGTIVLVVVAFIVALTRPEAEYQAEDGPDNIAHNYLLALQRDEYETAYSYLSPTVRGYPTSLAKFEEDIASNSFRFGRSGTDSTLTVRSADIQGEWATVVVIESRFREGDLFENGQSTRVFELEFAWISGKWLLVGGERYFAYCWNLPEGCG